MLALLPTTLPHLIFSTISPLKLPNSKLMFPMSCKTRSCGETFTAICSAIRSKVPSCAKSWVTSCSFPLNPRDGDVHTLLHGVFLHTLFLLRKRSDTLLHSHGGIQVDAGGHGCLWSEYQAAVEQAQRTSLLVPVQCNMSQERTPRTRPLKHVQHESQQVRVKILQTSNIQVYTSGGSCH